MTTSVPIPRDDVIASVNRAVSRCPRCAGRIAGCRVCHDDRALLERLKKMPLAAETVRREANALCWCNHRGTCFPCQVGDLLR